jgi:hypothetical protein
MAGMQIGKPIPVVTPLTPEPGSQARQIGQPTPLSEGGAPDGYKWDSVQGKYVRTAASYGADASDYTKNAMQGLAAATSAPSTGGYNPGTTWMGSAQVAAPTIGAYGSGGGNAYTPPPTTPQIQAPDMTASNAAAFASAKDTVGKTSQAALQSLSAEMARRGILGSGSETRGMERVFNEGQGQLGDVSRQQAINQAALAEQNALAGYQGGITQRGQDIGAQEAAAQEGLTARGQDIGVAESGYQGGITQRGQDLSSQEAAAQRALQLEMQQRDLQQRQYQQMLAGLNGALQVSY